MDKQLNHAFFTQNNIELLWELIADEYQLTNAKTQIMQEYKLGIRTVFDTNLQAFKAKVFDQELMTLNKTFLAQINAAVRNLYPDIREHLKKTKIKIMEPVHSTLTEPVMEPISHQDIQMKRRSEFNQRLDLQQQNLDMALGVAQKPADIDLSDQLPPEDKDPQSIAEQFARTLAERNYDPMPLPLQSQTNALKAPKKTITIDEQHNKVNEYQTQPFDNCSGSDSDPDTEIELNSNVVNNINNNGQIIEILHTVTDLLKNVMNGMKVLNEKIDKLERK